MIIKEGDKVKISDNLSYTNKYCIPAPKTMMNMRGKIYKVILFNPNKQTVGIQENIEGPLWWFSLNDVTLVKDKKIKKKKCSKDESLFLKTINAIDKCIKEWSDKNIPNRTKSICELYRTERGCYGCPVYFFTNDHNCLSTPLNAFKIHYNLSHSKYLGKTYTIACNECDDLCNKIVYFLKEIKGKYISRGIIKEMEEKIVNEEYHIEVSKGILGKDNIRIYICDKDNNRIPGGNIFNILENGSFERSAHIINKLIKKSKTGKIVES